MKVIKTALSNEVFEDGNVIVKKVIDTFFKNLLGGDEIEIIDEYGDGLEIIEEGQDYFVMNRLKGEAKMLYSDEEVIAIADKVKQFGKTELDYRKTAGFEDAYKYLGGTKDISDIVNILERDKVLLHNDLVEGNILINGKDVKLIDFEYSAYGNVIFDVASFIIERKLKDGQEELWVSQFNVDKEELEKVKSFLSEFWGMWASYMYELTSLEIYKEVQKWHEKNRA